MGQVLLRSIVSPLSELDCIWEVCNIHMLRCRLSLPYCVNCKVWYHQQYARSRLLSVRSKLYLSKKQSFVRFNWLHYSLRPSRYNITKGQQVQLNNLTCACTRRLLFPKIHCKLSVFSRIQGANNFSFSAGFSFLLTGTKFKELAPQAEARIFHKWS